ncbi:Uncharacterised protein [Atlantibacter hermannii]|nr:Uncharacterised protein [Atlantibacter hermannii]
MKHTLLKASLVAALFAASANLYAADNGLIAIITLHTTTRSLKRKLTARPPKRKSLATPRWWLPMTMT